MRSARLSKKGPVRKLPADDFKSMYREMLRIRVFENRVTDLFTEGAIKGTAHSYVGEEAIAVAVCANLKSDDYIGSNHRGHGHVIAKGGDLSMMMAEMMGKRTGYCGGLGGSMHIADLSLGIIGANGIVGAAMPLSAGAALTSQLQGTGRVAVAFFGDGGSNQGVFHETMNLAAVWKLPLVLICENNLYALTVPYSTSTSGPSIASRAAGYGVPGVQVDGNDPEAVYFVAQEAIRRARAGEGPTLIEALTYRWGQHSMRANLADPRPAAELEEWKRRDPLKCTEAELMRRKICKANDIEEMRQAVAAEIEKAVEFGKASDLPTLEFAHGAVYAPHLRCTEPGDATDRKISFSQAINEALAHEMERDPNVIVMGEDIGPTGGVFQATKGLHVKHGSKRVRDTPISEATFVGCGVGAALTGTRPVVELQFFDFVSQAMDMVVNQAAKLRFMMGGKPTIPLVIRGASGAGVRLAAQHSQSLESWFAHVPGLVVMGPSSPYEAKGLLISAIRDNNPVIFLESKLLYTGFDGPVPEQPYAIPIGKGRVNREGTDVTVVATMAMVPRALAAATQLAKEGISVEVIDPRTIRPLDEEIILTSVRKTHRLVIAHEACTRHGFGAEVAAMVNEKAFDWLDAPIGRVGAPDTPIPYNDELERMTVPSQQRIADAILEVLK